MIDTFNRARRRVRRMLHDLTGPWARLSREQRGLIRGIQASHLTYLSRSKLAELAWLIERIEREGVEGQLIETGCALGGSTVLIARTKRADRPLYVHDVFGLIPPPTGEDGEDVRRRYEEIAEGRSPGLGGEVYYGYEQNLREKVEMNLRRFGVDLEAERVSLIEGKVQETLRVESPVALAHIDVDWYEPVRVSLERIEPHLSPGGVLVLDDYHDWSGCRKAADEYFAGKWDRYRRSDAAGSLSLTRID